jgi:glycosyltransferase involved in cell wall biosynthesis
MTAATAPSPRHPAPPTPGADAGPRRWLFYKDRFAWPRSSGHDVHTFYLMDALARQGHSVSLATADRGPAEALAGLPLVNRYVLGESQPPVPAAGKFPLLLNKSQAKFLSYWGVDEDRVRQFAAAAADCAADVVVVSGLNVLPLLGAVAGRVRVWYAADEWAWHHLSMVKPTARSTWGEIKPALVKLLYERAYRPLLDRVWVVSDTDARAFRWLAGTRQTDVLPNGIDADYYAPADAATPVAPNSCAFWGRLDFGPNVQAVEWFVTKVWPRVRARVPGAEFRVFGFQPTPALTRFADRDGVTVTADLPDLRPSVRGCAAAVLPFVSGGGIKNKLLEAAAMALPVVATPRTARGLNGTPPLALAGSPAAFADALVKLWADAAARADLGRRARAWVTGQHTWDAAARVAAAGVAALTPGGPRR